MNLIKLFEGGIRKDLHKGKIIIAHLTGSDFEFFASIVTTLLSSDRNSIFTGSKNRI